MKLTWATEGHDFVEVFNFKEKDSLKTFFDNTNETTELVDIFESNKSLKVQTKKFVKRLNGFIHQSFRKVKISNKGDQRLKDLYNKRRILQNKTDDKSIEELQHVEETLAIEYSESMARKIRNELKEVNWEDGGFNPGKFWKLEKSCHQIRLIPPLP